MTGPQPPLDLDAFRGRYARIVHARDDARREYQEQALKEANAEFDYRKSKAMKFAFYRGLEKGVSESDVLAEGDVAHHRRERDRAHALAKSALLRIDELEANRAMLRAELGESQKIEWGRAA